MEAGDDFVEEAFHNLWPVRPVSCGPGKDVGPPNALEAKTKPTLSFFILPHGV